MRRHPEPPARVRALRDLLLREREDAEAGLARAAGTSAATFWRIHLEDAREQLRRLYAAHPQLV